MTRGSPSEERAFYVLLAASLFALGMVLWPFLYAFAMAAVVAVIGWPLFGWMLERTGGRRRLSALLMLGTVLVVLGVPVGLVVALAAAEAVQLAEQGTVWLASGELGRLGATLQESYATLRSTGDLAEVLPPFREVVSGLSRSLEGILISFTRRAGAGVPGLLGGLGRIALDTFVFGVAVYSFFAQGPAILLAIRRLSPLRRAYLEQLLDVFQQLATNVALGMVAAGAGQGAVAALGFWLAGVQAEIALGVITAITSVVPVVGSAVVWVPVVIVLLLEGRTPAAAFVAVWSMALTASTDNLIKPFLFGNRLQVSPLLMLLALLGGILSFGTRGLVLGPFLLVLFLTLYTIYVQDFVPRRAPAPTAEGDASG